MVIFFPHNSGISARTQATLQRKDKQGYKPNCQPHVQCRVWLSSGLESPEANKESQFIKIVSIALFNLFLPESRHWNLKTNWIFLLCLQYPSQPPVFVALKNFPCSSPWKICRKSVFHFSFSVPSQVLEILCCKKRRSEKPHWTKEQQHNMRDAKSGI